MDRTAIRDGYSRNCAELEAACPAPRERLRGATGQQRHPMDVYAYPIRHFDFHASQLSLPGTRTASA